MIKGWDVSIIFGGDPVQPNNRDQLEDTCHCSAEKGWERAAAAAWSKGLIGSEAAELVLGWDRAGGSTPAT